MNWLIFCAACEIKGQVFTECGTACPAVCGEEPAVFCTLQCVRGCQCPGGTMLDTLSQQCVTPDQCSNGTHSMHALYGTEHAHNCLPPGLSTSPPATSPPATSPPATSPPTTRPPSTRPPSTRPSFTRPPATDSTATTPTKPSSDATATDTPPSKPEPLPVDTGECACYFNLAYMDYSVRTTSHDFYIQPDTSKRFMLVMSFVTS